MNGRRFLVRLGTSAILLATALLLEGCLIIPVDYYSKGVRHNVSEESGSQLRPDMSTKEDVLLLLGEPDLVSMDEQRFGYTWTKVTAWIIVLSPRNSTGTEVTSSHLLDVGFDLDNRVSHVHYIDQWSPTMSERDLQRAIDKQTRRGLRD